MKRKIIILVILIVLSIGLSSCMSESTYEDLLLDYQSEIADRQDIYDKYIAIYDQLSNEVVESIVKVTKREVSPSTTSIGSGFIFFKDDQFYYILTNSHVVSNDSLLVGSISVTDYLGNEHDAALLASDSHYDLAVLSISIKDFQINPISFSETDLSFKDMVISVGYPNGQINSVTFGELIDFDVIDISNTSSETGIDFEVLIMDVPVETGSSGSLIINDNYEVVGIIYAGNFINSEETSEFAFGIPRLKIFEFFDLNEIPYQNEVTS